MTNTYTEQNYFNTTLHLHEHKSAVVRLCLRRSIKVTLDDYHSSKDSLTHSVRPLLSPANRSTNENHPVPENGGRLGDGQYGVGRVEVRLGHVHMWTCFWRPHWDDT